MRHALQTIPRALWLAALAALVLRLTFAFGYWTDKPLTRDELEYLSQARSVAHGQGFAYDQTLLADYASHESHLVPFGRAPGYPLFLALVGGGAAPATSTPSSVKAAQCVIGALSVVVIGLFTRRLFGPRAATASAWIAAAYPPMIWICSYALSEALYVPIGLLTAWVLDWAAAPGTDTRVGWRGVGLGLISGIGLLVRAATILFLPLGFLWLLVRRRSWAAIGMVLGAAIMILPWTVRNYSVYHRVVLVASDGGVTFWTGNNASAHGEGDLASNPDLAAVHKQLRDAHADLTEEEMEPVYYRESVGWIRSHPIDFVTLECRKLFYTIVPTGPSYRTHSRLYYGASLVSYLGVLPLAIVGFLKLRDRTRYGGLAIMVFASCLVCIVFFPQERFRLAIIDPALIVWAGGAFSRATGAA